MRFRDDDALKPPPNHLREFEQSQSFARKITPTVGFPQTQPGVKMSRVNPERRVFQRQRTNKAGRAAGQPRPELANLGQMRRPVVDVLAKYGTQQPVLPDIRIKMRNNVVSVSRPPIRS